MPYELILPRGIKKQLHCLREVHLVGQARARQGRGLLADSVLRHTETAHQDLLAANQAVQEITARLKNLRQQRDTMFARIRTTLGLFCEAVLRRTILENHSEAVLLHYRLDPRKTGKSHFTHRQWLNLGQQLIQGEARAVAAGFPAMAMPTIDRVVADLTGADHLLLAIARDQLALKDAQASRRAASRAAYRQLGDVAHHLRTALRHEKPQLIRGIIRTYGFAFTVTPSKAKPRPVEAAATTQPLPTQVATPQQLPAQVATAPAAAAAKAKATPFPKAASAATAGNNAVSRRKRTRRSRSRRRTPRGRPRHRSWRPQ